MIVKSKEGQSHVYTSKKLFEKLRKYQLKLNLIKFTFRMKSAKLLGFIVSNKGIEVDPNKVKAIQVMSAPETEKKSTKFPRETKLHNPFYFSINNHL